MYPSISPFFYTLILAHILTLIPSLLVHSITLPSDTNVLRRFSESIDPNSVSPTSFMRTWDFSVDPCETAGTQFLGILCTMPDGENSNDSFSRVSELDLEGDGLEGFLTPEIGNLTQLTTLNLSKNKFRGPIPGSLYNLRKLTSLILHDNFFSGSIADGIGRLRALEVIDVSRNLLSGTISPAFTAIHGLTSLVMSKNTLTGSIPNMYGNWKLATLDLSENQLYGGLPMLPTSLRSLSLGNNMLTGHVTSISMLKHLKDVDLSVNRFSGPINGSIFSLPEVVNINLSSNHFSSIEVIDMTDQASELKVLDASNNRLRGELPVNLVRLGSLTTVKLGHNLLTGQIPKEYFARIGKSWKSLFLENNFLQGSLPAQFNSSVHQIRGSLAENCLRNCPAKIEMCRGGQRSASDCVDHTFSVAGTS